MIDFRNLVLLGFIFSCPSAYSDFSVDEAALALVVQAAKAAEVAAEVRSAEEAKAKAYALRLAENPYLEDVVLFDSTYTTVSQKGTGMYRLSGTAEDLSLLSVIDRILPPGFKLVASGEHVLVEPTVSWESGDLLGAVLERTGLDHLLEFVIDWEDRVLAIRKATNANHTVLFDGRYSPVDQIGSGSHFIEGGSETVNLTLALDAIMPDNFRVVSVNPDVLVNATVKWNHDESLVSVLERAGLDNILSFDLDWDEKQVIVRGGKAFSPHQVVASQFVTRSFFVPFPSGKAAKPSDTGPLLSAAKVILENRGKIGSIKVTGISKSKHDSADDNLLESYALKRSETVFEKLAELGAPEELMVAESDFVRGFVKNVSGALIQVFGQSPKVISYSATEANKPMPNCGNLSVARASLRFNIDKAIRDCGFTVGDWDFGDQDTVSDWLVERAYKISVGRTVDDVLAHIGATYGISSSKEGSLINFFETTEGL